MTSITLNMAILIVFFFPMHNGGFFPVRYVTVITINLLDPEMALPHTVRVHGTEEKKTCSDAM